MLKLYRKFSTLHKTFLYIKCKKPNNSIETNEGKKIIATLSIIDCQTIIINYRISIII